MNTNINQQNPIYWKGKLCKFIKWDTMNLAGKLEIKVNKNFITVDISELTNSNKKPR